MTVRDPLRYYMYVDDYENTVVYEFVSMNTPPLSVEVRFRADGCVELNVKYGDSHCYTTFRPYGSCEGGEQRVDECRELLRRGLAEKLSDAFTIAAKAASSKPIAEALIQIAEMLRSGRYSDARRLAASILSPFTTAYRALALLDGSLYELIALLDYLVRIYKADTPHEVVKQLVSGDVDKAIPA